MNNTLIGVLAFVLIFVGGALIGVACDRCRERCRKTTVKPTPVTVAVEPTVWQIDPPPAIAPKVQPINENDLALDVARCEGLKDQVNIAQIKEVGRCYFEQLNRFKDEQIIATVRKHQARK